MLAPGIKEPFYVFEYRPVSLLSGGKPFRWNQLHLQHAHETLHRSVIVAVPRPAHAGQDSTREQRSGVIIAGIRAATIGMVDLTFLFHAPITECHVQRLQGQMSVVPFSV